MVTETVGKVGIEEMTFKVIQQFSKGFKLFQKCSIYDKKFQILGYGSRVSG